MIKPVYFTTYPHSVLCRTCVHSEEVISKENMRSEIIYLCHHDHPIHTGDYCTEYKLFDKLIDKQWK